MLRSKEKRIHRNSTEEIHRPSMPKNKRHIFINEGYQATIIAITRIPEQC